MRHARVEKVARTIAAQQPDLVALLGDFVDRGAGLHPIAPADVARRLVAWRAPLGTVAVLGNHDWSRAGARMSAALREAGIATLENEAHPIIRDGVRLWIVGVADLRSRTPSLRPLDEVPDGEPILLLTHDPDVFLRAPRRVALTLAGHTHGGQVNLPLLRRRFIPSREGPRFRAGLVERDGRLLFITSGVGVTGIPARLFALPEIAVLELQPL